MLILHARRIEDVRHEGTARVKAALALYEVFLPPSSCGRPDEALCQRQEKNLKPPREQDVVVLSCPSLESGCPEADTSHEGRSFHHMLRGCFPGSFR